MERDSSQACANGMSFSKRDSRLADAALVVSLSPDDVARDVISMDGAETGEGPLGGVRRQSAMERRAAEMGGEDLGARRRFYQRQQLRVASSFFGPEIGILFTFWCVIEAISREGSQLKPNVSGGKRAPYRATLGVPFADLSPVRAIPSPDNGRDFLKSKQGLSLVVPDQR